MQVEHTTASEPHSHQSDVQFRGRDQKVSALSFHVTLAQMRLARCRMSILRRLDSCGVRYLIPYDWR